MTQHPESCLVCGGSLEYLDWAGELTCSFCGRAERGHVHCPQGHYICEDCHGAGFLARLPQLLEQHSSASPYEIAEALLQDGQLPMLGCEHAHIAAGSLMRALLHANLPGVTQAHLDEALQRTSKQAISAYCGLSGVCGIVPALGAAYSVLVGGQCGRGPQTKAVMELVSRLTAITAEEAAPGCCKAYLRRCLHETADHLERTLGLALPPSDSVICRDVDRHPHGCRGRDCAYHPLHSREPNVSATPFGVAPSTTLPPSIAGKELQMSTSPAAQSRYDEFFQLAYSPGALDARTKTLVALGASLAAGCAP